MGISIQYALEERNYSQKKNVVLGQVRPYSGGGYIPLSLDAISCQDFLFTANRQLIIASLSLELKQKCILKIIRNILI